MKMTRFLKGKARKWAILMLKKQQFICDMKALNNAAEGQVNNDVQTDTSSGTMRVAGADMASKGQEMSISPPSGNTDTKNGFALKADLTSELASDPGKNDSMGVIANVNKEDPTEDSTTAAATGTNNKTATGASPAGKRLSSCVRFMFTRQKYR
eukprot:UN03733